MGFSANATNLKDIILWRDMYRLEMACQIVHDSIHERRGWTEEYMLFSAGTAVGYGSVAVGGPWNGMPTLYEFYVVPHQRLHLFELFRVLLEASGAAGLGAARRDLLLDHPELSLRLKALISFYLSQDYALLAGASRPPAE